MTAPNDRHEIAGTSAVLQRLRDVSLWWHAAALTAVLLALVPFVGTDVTAFPREGAIVLQAQTLAEDGRWTVEHPFPEVDPDGVAFPVDRAASTNDGWVVISGRPAYAALLAGLWSLGGASVPVALSVIGTVAAACAAALLMRRVAPGLAVLAFWVSGLGTTLFFEAFTVYSHTVAAALCGFACLAVFVTERRPTVMRALIASVLLGIAVLVSGLATLFGLVVVAVLGIQAVRHRSRAYAVAAGAIVVGVAAAAFADRWWFRSIVPTESHRQLIATGPDHPVWGRLDAALITWLEPGVALDPAGPIVLGLAFIIGMYGVMVARRGDTDRVGRVEFAAFGAAALAWVGVLVVVATSSSHVLVRGFAVGAPVVGLGVFAARRIRGIAGELACVAGAFVAVVVVTAFEPGVLTEWGARSLVLVLPILVPVILVWWQELGSRLPVEVRRLGVWSLVLGSAAMTALAVHTLHSSHESMRELHEYAAEIGADSDPGDGGPPVVLALSHTAGSASWPVWEDQRWLSVHSEHLPALLDRMEAVGVESVVLVSQQSAAADVAGLDVRVVEYGDERGVLLVLEDE